MNSKIILNERHYFTNHQEIRIIKYSNSNYFSNQYDLESTDDVVNKMLLENDFFKTQYNNKDHLINDFNNFCYSYNLNYNINKVWHRSTDYITEDRLWSIDRFSKNKWYASIEISFDNQYKEIYSHLIKDFNLDKKSKKLFENQFQNLLNDYYMKNIYSDHYGTKANNKKSNTTRKIACKTSLEIFKKCYQERSIEFDNLSLKSY